MKLGTKIALGFVSLVGIAVLLGGLAAWNMKNVETQSTILAGEYVPEMKIATDLRGAANQTMFEMRGYAFTEDGDFYKRAQTEIAAMKRHLQEAADLAEEAVHLKALKGQIATINEAVATYEGLMAQTEEQIAVLNEERGKLDTNAAAYMKNMFDFLTTQNEAFKKELSERQRKIQLVTEIVDVGTKARVSNFKAQATGDMKLMRNAIDVLATLKAKTDELRTITRSADDIRRIDATEAAARAYTSGMERLIETSSDFEEHRESMDVAAATYMEQCSALLSNQNEKMRREFNQDGANLEERLQKITLINEIIAAGDTGRVLNFKSQATGDPEFMREAIKTVAGVKRITGELRKIIRDPADIKRIDDTEAASDAYRTAMEGYLAGYLGLDDYRNTMDEAAETYVAGCVEFLEGQQTKLTHDMTERHTKITLVNDVIGLTNDTRMKAFKAQALRLPALMEEAQLNFPKMEPIYADLRKMTRQDVNLQQIANTKAAGDAYSSALAVLTDGWKTLQDLSAQRREAGLQVVAACGTAADAGMESTDRIANEAASSLSSSTTFVTVGLVVAVIVGILLAFFITRGITKPLNRIIFNLNEGSDQVNAAAGQVASASQELASGASEQASSLEETSSALEEMAAMTRTNAENSRQANELSGQARTAAENGDRTMHQLNDAMAGINESSVQISKIIKVIEEIAFQTNLLALNAAVEAARAGEHGKGFAVVADEVRNLAQRAAQAARETTGLIEDSVNKAKEGTEVASAVGKALGAIVGDVTKVTELIDGIAKASEEQAQGVDQVNMAVSQMDQVTQQNAANAEESASAAEELSAQAESVRGIVAELAAMVTGGSGRSTHAPATPGPHKASGLQLKAKTPAPAKKELQTAAVGGAADVTMEDFSEFEDGSNVAEF